MARNLGASLLPALLVLGCAGLPAGSDVPSPSTPRQRAGRRGERLANKPRPGTQRLNASLLVGLLTLACAGLPGASVTPAPSPSDSAATATAGRSATASPPPSSPTASIPLRSPSPPADTESAVVSVGPLNIRVAPSRSAALLDSFGLTNPLAAGTRVLVLGDAVEADDYRWYPVAPSTEPVSEPPVGWVAGGTKTEDWLRPDTAPCPEPTISSLGALSDVQRLGCYGSTSISLVARQVTLPPDAGLGGTCVPRTSEQPTWLICDNVPDNLVSLDGVWDPPTPASPMLRLFFDPATGITPVGLAPPGTTGPTYQIRGHFGDPASLECAAGARKGSLVYMGDWLHCARQFVVEALVVLP